VHAGVLTVERQGELLSMDFPARPPSRIAPPPGLVAALRKEPEQVWASRDLLVVYPSAADVLALTPDFDAIARLEQFAVIVTAPGGGAIDFVSRFFVPAQGIPEDPVTGSAHCTLVPYWANRLGKSVLRARQVSRRGGDLFCALRGDRVDLAGHAVLYLEGTIEIAT
jgi:predicted PhzF superfamily epimerase YddE/YHI9